MNHEFDFPLVVAVLADLSGKPEEEVPLSQRKCLRITAKNFDERLKVSRPRVAFQVNNTLTGEGRLSIDITFHDLEHFSPTGVARSVDALSTLLNARQQLAELLTYLDENKEATDIIETALKDKELLDVLASYRENDDT
jgi:type VI secretion system protein ImpB